MRLMDLILFFWSYIVIIIIEINLVGIVRCIKDNYFILII